MKLFKNFIKIGLTVISLPLLSSCKSDEPGVNNAANSILDFDGERLKMVANYYFSYDDEGRLTKIDGNSQNLQIDYENATLEYNGDIASVKFNKNGYISELSASWNEKENELYHSTGNGAMKYSYDSNGHLVSISLTSQETGFYEGETFNLEVNYTTNLKWTNDNLTAAEISGYEMENGDKYNYTERYDISYGDQANVFYQIPLLISQFIYSSEDDLFLLSCVGLMGKGPAYLPTRCFEEDYSENNIEEDFYYSQTYTMSFQLNGNGSLSFETSSWHAGNYFDPSLSIGSDSLSDKNFATRTIEACHYIYSFFSTRNEVFNSEKHNKGGIRDFFIKQHTKK